MANISTENINTLAQLAASISDGDYIYIYKAASNSFARIERSVFAQTIAGSSVASDVVKANVDSIVDKLNELISNLAGYALTDEVAQMADLDWEDSGGGSGDEPTPTPTTPTLTQPTSSSINVGTLAYNASNVVKTVTVEGSNLTQPLSVVASGTGFSVSPATISAANANNGTTISITYTNSGAGDGMTKSGSLTISSSEVSKTITLTAKKNSQPVTTSYTVSAGTLTDLTLTSSQSTVQSGGTYNGTLALAQGVTNKILPSQITLNGSYSSLSYDSSTGAIVISGVASDITINASAQSVVTGEYVQNGLVLHLDGINRGGVSGHWKSLVTYNNGNGFNDYIDFTLTDATESSDHVSFNGTTSKGVANISALEVLANGGTIEACIKNCELVNDMMCVMHNAYGRNICFAVFKSSNYYWLSMCTGGSQSVNTENMAAQSYDASSFLSGSYSCEMDDIKRNGTSYSTHQPKVQNTDTSSYLSLMFRHRSDNDAYSKGDIYSVRVYNRQLTNEERAQNLAVDQQRFNI